MKLFLMSLIATSLAKKEPVEIGWKEKQKVGHLKRNYAQMLDLFFIQNDQASKPVGAVRFGTQLKEKMAKWHEMMVDTWHRCGRASLDPSFERMIDEEIRFNHFEPFKGMTQLTNQYKKWIERQIHTGCRTQREQQYFWKRVHSYGKQLKLKYCKYVDDSNTELCSKFYAAAEDAAAGE